MDDCEERWNSTNLDDEPSTSFDCNETLLEFPVNDSLEIPVFYTNRFRIVGTLFQGIILLVGVLGNLMVITVVTRVRALHSPTNCYLMSLAVADLVVLISSVPNEILYYHLVGNQWLWGDLGCALFIFFQNLGINTSSLSLIAFTFERYIAICRPMRAHTVCTQRRARRIIILVWCCALVYCAPWLFLTTTKPLNYRGFPNARCCDFKRPRDEYLPYYFTDLVVFYLVPLVVSCILYGLIARTLLAKRMVRAAPPATQPSRGSTVSSRSQVVKMLAAVVAVFATLWLPYRGLLVYNSFAILFSKPKFMDLWFLMFAKTCVYINSAINPILYNAMSTRFRRAFQQLLLCGEGSRRSGSGTGTSPSLREAQAPRPRSSRESGRKSRPSNSLNTTVTSC